MHKVKCHSTVEKIAKKHRLDVSFVRNQLNMGIPIEHEHTNDRDLATDIALQHLDEIPDYYTRLKKMEHSAKKSHDKKYKDVTEARKMKGKNPCWKGYEMIGKKRKGNDEVPNCVSIKEEIEGLRYCPKCDKNESAKECKYGEKYWSMYSVPIKLGKKYTPNTPHPGNMPESHDQMKVENVQRGPILPNEKGKTIYPKGQGPKATGATLFPLIKNKTFKEFVIEAKTAAWQRKEGKKQSGGLNEKGVKSYRKQHRGSKLKTAVTTEPSKLKKDSKSWNRRKSFCSRMSGMKSKLTSAKTARDPNSRINKSLRAWNC